jgi:hypothetical protein
MKNFKLILIMLFTSLVYGHKNVLVQKKYGNVNLVSSTAFYTEDINRNLITAQYYELLLKEINYKEPVYLRLDDEGSFNFRAWIQTDVQDVGLHIVIDIKEHDITKTLMFLENVMSNIKKLDNEKKNFSTWYISQTSPLIKKILSNKIYRPKEVSELNEPAFFDYYYVNGSYHIISHQNREIIEVAILNKILQFKTITPSLLCLFIEKNSILLVTGEYKYDFDKQKYFATSEQIPLTIESEWKYSFRPYTIKTLGQKYVLFETLFRDQVSLYSIKKRVLIQNLDAVLGE